MSGRWTTAFLCLASPVLAGESFEASPAGPLTSLATPLGTWSASTGHAEIHRGHARDGEQALKIQGGEARTVELTLAEPLAKPGRLAFWAERWTAKPPFGFVIEAAGPTGPFRPIHDASAVKTGGFLTLVEAAVPTGTARLKFRATTQAGVMLDELELAEERPMTLTAVSVHQPVVPVLVRKPVNPALGIKFEAAGALEPLVLESVTLSLAGTTASWHLQSDGSWQRHHRDEHGRPLADLQNVVMNQLAARRRGAARA